MYPLLLAISAASAGTAAFGPAPGTAEDWYDAQNPVVVDTWLLGNYPPESRMEPTGLDAWCAARKESVAAHESRIRPARVTLNSFVYCAEVRREPKPNTPLGAGQAAVKALWIEWWVRSSATTEGASWKRLSVRRFESDLASGSIVALPLDPAPLTQWRDEAGLPAEEYSRLAVVLSIEEGGERVPLREFYLEGTVPDDVRLTDKEMKGATSDTARTTSLTTAPRLSVGLGAVSGGPAMVMPQIAPRVGVSYRLGKVTAGLSASGGGGNVDIEGETFSQVFLSGALSADVPVAYLGTQASVGPAVTAGYLLRTMSRDGASEDRHAPFVGGGLRGRWLPGRRVGLVLDPSVVGIPLADGTWTTAWSVGLMADLYFGRSVD